MTLNPFNVQSICCRAQLGGNEQIHNPYLPWWDDLTSREWAIWCQSTVYLFMRRFYLLCISQLHYRFDGAGGEAYRQQFALNTLALQAGMNHWPLQKRLRKKVIWMQKFMMHYSHIVRHSLNSSPSHHMCLCKWLWGHVWWGGYLGVQVRPTQQVNVCLCVCVRVRERERQGQKRVWSFHLQSQPYGLILKPIWQTTNW